ncbi:MAG: DNA polymerase III subunit tau [Firmicutes bacterium ADurb.Bin506]|nr:MAG: DNA polymerase III subunit tau [Firmicutes bacterium ADurb.Bin506]
MPIAELFGQQEAVKKLDGELLSGTLSHAYMIWGPAGSDRWRLAMALALAANCTGREGADASREGLWYCGECSNCTKLLAGVHPDFAVVRPDGKVIKIDQIREMQSRIALRPGEARLKTWVIDDAHTMNEESQNCLLKVLEEPPGHALIMLLLDEPGALLPTISSRCHSIRLGSVDRESLVEWGRRELGMSAERAAVLAAVSSGLRGKMERLARDADYFKVRNAIISRARSVMWCGDGGLALTTSEKLLDMLKRSSGGARGAARAGIADEASGDAIDGAAAEGAADGAAGALDGDIAGWQSGEDDDASETAAISTPEGACEVLAVYMRDVLAKSLGGGPDVLINIDLADEISADAERGRPEQFRRWAEKCMSTAEALAANANARLALDDLMLDLALLLT